jgi:hypothetical protein
MEKMINEMKEQIAKTQKIKYPEQLTVAQIYYLVGRCLAEACRQKFGKCELDCPKEFNKDDINMDAFILLSGLKEDGFISQEYDDALFDSLLKIRPDLKIMVEKDKEVGLL